MVRPVEVPKGLPQLVAELLQSLQVIRDSLDLLAIGQTHQVLPLSGQLRALLLEKRRDAHALLPEVAARLGVEPTIFVMPDATHAPAGLPTPVFRLAGFPFSLQQELPSQVEIPLVDLPARKLIDFDGNSYSLRTVIEFYANRSGGAHYSKSMPEVFARLLSMSFPGIFSMRSVLVNAMLQIGRAVYDTGLDLVRRVTEFHTYLHLGVAVVVPGSHLIDVRYPGAPMRFSIYIDDDSGLTARIIGIDGDMLLASIVPPLDWSTPHLIRVSFRHGADLAARLEIAVDDDGLSVEVSAQAPLFFFSQLHEFERTLNKAVEGEPAGSSIALADWAWHGRLTPEGAEETNGYYQDEFRKPDRRVFLYPPGSSGLAANGTTEMTSIGPVTLQHMVEVMRDCSSGDA